MIVARGLALALVVAACSMTEPTPTTPASTPPDVTIELGGVTLGDDCTDDRVTNPIPPPANGRTAATQPPAAAASIAAGACSDPSNCHGPPAPACTQTSMQLALRASRPTTIKVKKVELLDGNGKVVDVLAARSPTRWADDKYVAWDEAIGAELAASYKLAAPNWTKIANGKWNAAAMKFALRVTVTVDGSDRTIERRSISVMLEPEVAT